MAQEKENQTSLAESGTEQTDVREGQHQAQKTSSDTGCPAWDNMGKEQLPFFNPIEEVKKAGLIVKFLAEGPRKETQNTYDPNHPKPELWFDVSVDGKKMTWTISQATLLIELKKNEPLKNKIFDIRLVPVSKEFKEQNPRFKGKERYEVHYIRTDNEPETTYTDADKADKEEPIDVEQIEAVK